MAPYTALEGSNAHGKVVPELPGPCHISQFKSLSPQELQAFKRAKDSLEESLLQKDYGCHSRLFPRPWDLRQLQVQDRAVALEAELALTLRVLGAVADSSPRDTLDQPLHVLRHIHSRLQACVPAQPTAGPRPRGRLPPCSTYVGHGPGHEDNWSQRIHAE
ncbi:interferon lambda-2 [Tupaia chinensis]|uniref:interferon lambda-2 n=1 Tax=Tupaia chinensis TaxID=246437 RepID=UPI0003C8C554|nr:interferon lambda-2 [Tupaia chinensis]